MQEGEPQVSDAAVVAAVRAAAEAAANALRASATAGADGGPPLRSLTVLITVMPMARVVDLDGAPLAEDGGDTGMVTPKAASEDGRTQEGSMVASPRAEAAAEVTAGLLGYSSPAVTLAVALAERLAAVCAETTTAAATAGGGGVALAAGGGGTSSSSRSDFAGAAAGEVDPMDSQDGRDRADRDRLRGVVSKQYRSEEVLPLPLARAWQVWYTFSMLYVTCVVGRPAARRSELTPVLSAPCALRYLLYHVRCIIQPSSAEDRWRSRRGYRPLCTPTSEISSPRTFIGNEARSCGTRGVLPSRIKKRFTRR